MKRLLISLAAVAVMLPAYAQTANPKAKVDPKNNKVSRPVVEKPKPKLMTRDELRSCMKTSADNEAEAKLIKEEEGRFNVEHQALIDEKAALVKRGEEVGASMEALKKERDEIVQFGENIKTRVEKEKLDKDALKKLQDEYVTRANAMDKKIEAHNQSKDGYVAESKGFDGKIEAHNKRRDELAARVDKHLDATDDWKAACYNKSYDELDELAIKKEMAAGK